MYNSMGTGRRGRLSKGEMDKKQYNIHTKSIQESRKDMEQRQIKYSMGTRTNKPLLPFLSSS
jgi:hypothetical protein